MLEALDQLLAEAKSTLSDTPDAAALEAHRVAYLGKKGKLTALSAGMRDVAKEDKPAVGQKLNEVRTAITEAIDSQLAAFEAAADAERFSNIDVTLPGRPQPAGAVHPLTQLLHRAVIAMRGMGFQLASGPEVESEWRCFDALNTPFDHPARNEKDTFYFEDGRLLRTHTSTVQIATMEKAKELPVRIIAPGTAFRRDEIDATHSFQFTQFEALSVGTDIKLSDLKGSLELFFRSLFGTETEVRFRPHFFPFTEPSLEIDIKLVIPGKGEKWIEVGGCGMVDPAVFEEVCEKRGDRLFDPETTTGFAFGLGIDRLAMIYYSIPDIRLLIESDQRFLAQFA